MTIPILGVGMPSRGCDWPEGFYCVADPIEECDPDRASRWAVTGSTVLLTYHELNWRMVIAGELPMSLRAGSVIRCENAVVKRQGSSLQSRSWRCSPRRLLQSQGFSKLHPFPRIIGAGTQDVPYAAVSCTTKADCAAVGPGLEFRGVTGGVPTVISKTGDIWGTRSRLKLPSKGSAEGSTLSGVFCTGPGDCETVGSMTVDGSDEPLTATESSGVWQVASTANLPKGATGGGFQSVWCASAGNCVAVGPFGSANGDSTFASTEVAGAGDPR